MEKPTRPSRGDGASILTVCLGRMPQMLREILLGVLARHTDLRVISDEQLERDPAAVLRDRQPAALILGRPDCDHIGLERLFQASPATRIVQVSPEGHSAVVYGSGVLPLTIDGLSPERLLDLLATAGSPSSPGD
jgi:hypothetical protein